MKNSCPPPFDFARAVAEATPAFQEHLSTCPACQNNAFLLSLGAELPTYTPSGAKLSALKSRLLDASSMRRPPSFWAAHGRLLIVGVAVAAAAAVALFILFSGKEAPIKQPEIAQNIQPAPQEPAPPKEIAPNTPAASKIVQLSDGTFTLSPPEGQRSLVAKIGETTISIWGTAFVVASSGELAQIKVIFGKAELQRPNEPSITLQENETWKSPKATPTKTTSTQTTSQPTEVLSVIEPPSAPKESAEELAFREGVDAMRQKDFTLAAERFLITASSSGSLAEDGAFFYASALEQSGKEAEAILAFSSFLTKYPSSGKVLEAKLHRGSLRLSQGDVEGAKKDFQEAQAGSPAIKAKAEKGLEAIQKTSPSPGR